ncbi:MAG: glucose-6-phosphate dehydrogenase [Gammaproteobacteria bacterium]|nr:glucose-6-phosphate dehydrogenase [Gammaproteobacteria bacterium]
MEDISSFDLVLFGGSGDLAMRKLLPALYNRHRNNDLPEQGRIIAVARQQMEREEYITLVREHCQRYLKARYNEETFASFAHRLQYLPLDANSPADYAKLKQLLEDNPGKERAFFLSTSSELFSAICTQLAAQGLAGNGARVVLEKPLGHDLKSSKKINDAVTRVFGEAQIFRIDHYLGKEPVQNLMALRFGNALFEPMWERTWVRDVQITIAEDVGIERRADFYDRTGALRDVLQNHLLQLLCIIAMEPPSSIDADAVRDEKLKVVRALAPFESPADVAARTVRGQYRAGAVAGQPVPGYLEESGVPEHSGTETFVALKTWINNWRWSGVPFYLRTGKRMQQRLAEIVINFHNIPHSIFPQGSSPLQGNRLVIELQPEEGLKLYLMAKRPGDKLTLKPVYLNLDFSDHFPEEPMDAYERLLTDVLRGRLTLFMRRDELDAAWAWCDPILQGWEAIGDKPKPYAAGTWGPAAASALVAKDGSVWHEES